MAKVIKIVLFGLLLGIENSAFAQGQLLQPPQLVQIVNVPANDTLNVRAAALATSKDIGDLQNGVSVELLEIQDGWARIIWGEGDGWISARYTRETLRPALPSGLPLALDCGGTEPFWDLRLYRLGTVSINGGSQPITASGISRNNRYAYFFQTPEATGVLRAKICIDGMSDRNYGWEIDVVTGQGMLSGCCRAI